MALFLTASWLSLLIVAFLLFVRSPKRAPSYHEKGIFSIVANATGFVADPIRFIQSATHECGNVFGLRILSIYNVWLRGNAMNKYYLDVKEDVWSFTGGIGIFLDRLVEKGHWDDNNYKTLLASISRYSNRATAQRHVIQVTDGETRSQVNETAGNEIRLFEVMSRLINRILVRSLWGEDFYRHNLEELLDILYSIEGDVGSAWIFLPSWVPHPVARRLDRARHRMKEIFVARMNGRAAHGEGHKSEKGEWEDYVSFTMRDKATAQMEHLMPGHHTSILFAAHTSSVAVVGWAIIALLRRPDIMQQVTREVRENPDAVESPLLQACIKETTRLYTAMRTIRIARQDVKLPTSGYNVPKGAFISISPYLTHRDPANFERPDEWLPERWLDGPRGDGSSKLRGGKYADPAGFIPFGAGCHRCVGEKLAMIMISNIMMTLLRTWDVEWADEGVPLRTDFENLDFEKAGSPWLKGDVGVRFRLA